MKTRTWDIPLVTFLSGGNTVILKNKKELEEFINQMALMSIDVSTLSRADASKGLLVEFDNGKGTTFWNYNKTMEQAIEESKKWYEMDPFKWEEIKVLSFAVIQDEYWKQKILQEAESNECEVSPKRTEEIITTFLNDDSVWYTIEESIRYYLEEKEHCIQDEDCEDEDVYESREVLKPSMNLYAYLNKYSNGAWISFTFIIQGREYYCHGVGDCPCDPQLLKMYEVTEETCLYVSQSQGSAYVLKVRKIDEK